VFTGIVEALGRIENVTDEKGNRRLEISCPFAAQPGESIAVDGACLTVRGTTDDGRRTTVFIAEAVAETVRLTTLKEKRRGGTVNLERAMLPSGRLGGHLVAGHVDEVGKVLAVRALPGSKVFEFGVSEAGSRLVVSKGSIAVDGISLTVAEAKGVRVSVSVIPYTIEHTTLRDRRVGDEVNIEFDIIGKYVAKMLDYRTTSRRCTPMGAD
jgi:riboflavin synthase